MECLRVLVWICRTRRILPRSWTLSPPPLITTSFPVTCGVIADVHEGLCGNVGVYIKLPRTCQTRLNEDEWIGLVRRPLFSSPVYPAELGSPKLCQEAVIWKHMGHLNIVPFLGTGDVPLQLVSKLMPAGNLTQYIKKHPDADRLAIVRFSPNA